MGNSLGLTEGMIISLVYAGAVNLYISFATLQTHKCCASLVLGPVAGAVDQDLHRVQERQATLVQELSVSTLARPRRLFADAHPHLRHRDGCVLRCLIDMELWEWNKLAQLERDGNNLESLDMIQCTVRYVPLSVFTHTDTFALNLSLQHRHRLLDRVPCHAGPRRMGVLSRHDI